MMIQRWFVGVVFLVAGGAAFRGDVISTVVAGPTDAVEKRDLRSAQDDKEFGGESRETQGKGQGQIQGSFAALRMIAGVAGTPAEQKAGAKGRRWEERSLEEDPANLKGERVRAVDAEPLAVDQGAAGLELMLKRLRTRASLMMIVAHPDDEDGGMLTYESRGLGARVGMLTLTRGEGGQNVVTGDFNDALGLVRTRELLAADRYMGVDQMFGTEVDFGFSKTKEEAFEKWTHERVLYDAVRAVRLYRPLVVTSVFLGAPSDGHGQHQVSGEIAQEVFNAAADPKVFPEMGLPVWAPMKVYGRMPFAPVTEKGMFDYATGKFVPRRFPNYVTKTWSDKTPTADVTVPEGEPSAALGKSYVQFAREGLALQRTQIGAGVRVAPAGRMDVGYTRYGSRLAEGSIGQDRNFFDGMDVTLAGIADLAGLTTEDARVDLRRALLRVDAKVVEAQKNLKDSGDPKKAASALRDGLVMTRQMIVRAESMRGAYDVTHELRVKEAQFSQALVLALGMSVRAEVAKDSVEPGTSFPVKVEVQSSTDEPVSVRERWLSTFTSVGNNRLNDRRSVDAGPVSGPSAVTKGHGYQKESTQSFPAETQGTRPYFSRPDIEQPFYTVREASLRNAPVTPAALTAHVGLEYGGVPFEMVKVVGMTETTEGKTVFQPLQVVPAVSVSVTPGAGVVPSREKSFVVRAQLRGDREGGGEGVVRMEAPKGWRLVPERAPWKRDGATATATVPFTVEPERIGAESSYKLSAVASYAGKEYREGFAAVGYPGLVRDHLYASATYRARGVEVTVPAGLRVAYLPGTGDAVEASLADIGIPATTVSVADIAAGKLAGFDALVMGVRTYAAHRDLPTVTGKLTDFASGGGVVVVQYQSGEYTGGDAPYPLWMGSGLAERVVEEDSRVQLLEPSSQVLSWPNRITEKDFSGWVEERGHGFMREWDARYQAVTEVHDAGQDPQKGGLLVARVGRGAYVYCAYALYRQMPEGVPGAFRLMANLVSLGRKP